MKKDLEDIIGHINASNSSQYNESSPVSSEHRLTHTHARTHTHAHAHTHTHTHTHTRARAHTHLELLPVKSFFLRVFLDLLSLREDFSCFFAVFDFLSFQMNHLARILNAHIESLQWIDENLGKLVCRKREDTVEFC